MKKFFGYVAVFFVFIILWGYQYHQFGRYVEKKTHISSRSNVDFSFFDSYMNFCHKNHITCTVFPFQSMISNSLWASVLQKVVLNPYDSYSGFLNIYSLSPYWIYPYVFGQIVIPVSPSLSGTMYKEKSRDQSISIGEIAMKYVCVNNKCPYWEIPGWMGFVSYYYKKDYKKALYRYEITALQDQVPYRVSKMPEFIKKNQATFFENELRCLGIYDESYCNNLVRTTGTITQ